MVAVLIILSFFMSSDLIISLFNMLPIDIVNRYVTYLDGYWAGDFLNDVSWKGRLAGIIGQAINYAICILYVCCYSSNNKKFNSLINSVLLLVLISTPFATIHGRFFGVFVKLVFLYFFYSFLSTHFYQKCLSILFCLQIISIGMEQWSIRRQMAISDIRIIANQPVPMIMMHTYDQVWIDKFVFSDGDFLRFDL